MSSLVLGIEILFASRLTRSSSRFRAPSCGNAACTAVPVVKISDERGTERWFIDLEDNPLLVNFLHRNYQQKLISITTDRPNTLRWIKSNKKR